MQELAREWAAVKREMQGLRYTLRVVHATDAQRIVRRIADYYFGFRYKLQSAKALNPSLDINDLLKLEQEVAAFGRTWKDEE